MSALYRIGNELLRDTGALARHADCCCGPSCCGNNCGYEPTSVTVEFSGIEACGSEPDPPHSSWGTDPECTCSAFNSGSYVLDEVVDEGNCCYIYYDTSIDCDNVTEANHPYVYYRTSIVGGVMQDSFAVWAGYNDELYASCISSFSYICYSDSNATYADGVDGCNICTEDPHSSSNDSDSCYTSHRGQGMNGSATITIA